MSAAVRIQLMLSLRRKRNGSVVAGQAAPQGQNPAAHGATDLEESVPAPDGNARGVQHCKSDGSIMPAPIFAYGMEAGDLAEETSI